MERRIVRICKAGDQLSVVQILSAWWKPKTRFFSSVVVVRTLQNIKTDATQLVNIGVEDFGQEADLGRDHWVVVRKEELEFERATYRIAVTIRG